MVPDQPRLNQLRTGMILLTRYTLYTWRFNETLWGYQKNKKYSSVKTNLVSILDNLSYYLSALSKTQPLPTFLNNNNILPFLSLQFSFVSHCLPVSHNLGSQCFLHFLYQHLRNSKHHIPIGFELKFVSFNYF